METFFQNNLYVLFALIVYYLLLNDKPKNDNQKIVILYIFISMLAIFNILDLKYMVLISLACLFIYFELLSNDEYKYKIIKKLSFKIIDFSYLVIIKYHIFTYILSLIFISDTFNSIFKIPFYVNILLFLSILIKLILVIIDNDFEMYTFSQIYSRISKLDFGNYKKLSDSKIRILVYIEDKSFFERKNDYTFLCWDFLKYRMNRINIIIEKIQDGKCRKHKISHILKFISYVIKQFYCQIKEIKNYRRFARGYSTIDMQLFRTIGVKNGYEKVYQRKIMELIYSQLFFKGLKEFYKINYNTVSSEYFKNFLLANYVKYAPVIINNKYSFVEIVWNKNIEDINDCEFFLSVLCLSGKLNKYNLNFNYINKIYDEYIKRFLLNEDELRNAIRYLNNYIEN